MPNNPVGLHSHLKSQFQLIFILPFLSFVADELPFDNIFSASLSMQDVFDTDVIWATAFLTDSRAFALRGYLLK